MSFNTMDEIFPSQPDTILGVRREHMQPSEKYQSVFLPGDVILFQNPDWAPSPPSNLFSSSPSLSNIQGWMIFCDYCNLDKIVGWTIFASICVLFKSWLG